MIAIGSDHRGYKLKEGIKEYLNNVKDFGCFSEESVDYPDIARIVAKNVSDGTAEKGILICGSGIGMSMAANRLIGVRAALCRNEADAEMGRKHNNSNVLVMGADFTNMETAKKIIAKWMKTDFEGGRHERRVNKMDWKMEIGASLLSKPENMSKEKLGEFINKLEKTGVDSIHWDVMDGKYNSNNTWSYQGPEVIKSLRPVTKLPFVAHLMIANPAESIGLFNDAGCNRIIFHYEAGKIKETIDKIKSFGRAAGIAIEPETPVEKIKEFLTFIDTVLVMTVKTGYAGQGFMDMTDKIKELDKIRSEKKLGFTIAVDGGINKETGKLCREAGADVLAAASYIRNNDHARAIESLRG
jgi:ribulose-phosphate 3-epimerase